MNCAGLWSVLMLLTTLTACEQLLERDWSKAGFATPSQSNCGEQPNIYVIAKPDRYDRLSEMLTDVGFTVYPLPLDVSPFTLKGSILLGADLAGSEDYDNYISKNSNSLYDFVDAANVLIQLNQDADNEPTPPFLPTTHNAVRSSRTFDETFVTSPSNPLLSGLKYTENTTDWKGVEVTAPSSFSHQDGFEVILAGDEASHHPLLMEGAYGQGRIVLSSLSIDDDGLVDDAAQVAFADTLLGNLRQHVVDVCRRETTALDITPSSSGPDIGEDSFTLIALPDTQVYSLRYPGLFDAQTTWIARNTEALRIKFVMQLGDIVNNNTPLEWQRASASMQLLDSVVPYGLAPGNHDYGPSGDGSTRDTLFNDYFSYSDASSKPTWGGAFEQQKLDNTFHLFDAGGRKWIIFFLEWAPRPEVVDWANEIMSAHPDRFGIMATHAYMYNDDLRFDHTDDREQKFNPYRYKTPGKISDGEELWQNLIRRHHFVMTFNGHTLGDGTGYLVSTTDMGNQCHQMLANYQMRDLGGEAYLRILEIETTGHVQVRTYSPLLDRFLEEDDQQFEFDLW